MGGVRIEGKKIYTLAYADDVVILADREEELEAMIRRLERYMEGKDLELNVEKTKIVGFRKAGGRMRERVWKWKGKRIEVVNEFKYLGYVVSRNGKQEAHIRDRVKKAGGIMKQVWGIGKRRFGRIWQKRIWMFDTLVWTVMGYGAEIWGWEEREREERTQERFLKWVMGADWRTPGYMIREEVKRDKLRIRAGKRAWEFEKKLDQGKGGVLARACRREMRGRMERGRVCQSGKRRGRIFLS